MMKKILLTISGLMATVAIMLLSSCYPGDTVSYADLDLVTTVYDTKTNFQELSTFVMPDTIIQLKDTLNTSNNTDLSRAYDDLILGRIKQNMLDNGFVEATDPENNPPDVILTISAMATTTTTVWYDYPYYWGWYGGWGWYYKSTGYYDYWYPYYPWGGATYITSYSSGTLLMSMNDLRNVDAENDSIRVVWLGAINGLLGETNKADIMNRLEYNIDKAFDQSSYLKQN
jgi:hypothetical protein